MSGTASTCRIAQPPVQLPLELSEISGAAVSRAWPGIIWSHTDSGTEPALFALDASGNIRATIPVGISGGGEERDWEDVAIGPCASGDCIYVGDIGDNDAVRAEVLVHRLAEPDTARIGDRSGVETFRLRYPNGPADAEALFVLPSGRIFIVTKGTESPVTLYEAQLESPDSPTVVRLVRTLSEGPVPLGDMVTGAAASEDGEWVVLRTHVNALVYRTADLLGTGDAEPAVVADLRPLREPQGEGIGFGPSGAMVLTSEGGAQGAAGLLSMIWCSGLDR